MPVNKQLR